ncbi:disintegrin and metalloproteinase domain-containing protein 10-like [Tachypleus tridentatus]|uniref:disintegrin and metalloproteinase domain-containing protein 10-like n=1 Tax=Tachypleus tridentatus TaxID=6853 RepID=UPI003FD3C42B
MGLAYKPAPGATGGICQKPVEMAGSTKYLNTLIATVKHQDRPVPKIGVAVIVTHEIGHSFGGPHDKEETGDECSPGDEEGGNYIMYPAANSGDKPNHLKFSPCSIEEMSIMMKDRATCFKNHVNSHAVSTPRVLYHLVIDIFIIPPLYYVLHLS